MRTQGHQYIVRSLRPPNWVLGAGHASSRHYPGRHAGGCGGRGTQWARFGCLGRRALQAAMRSAGVLTVSIPLPRVYLRHVWPPYRRGGHRQRLRSRASSPPGPAPAPPRGRASAGAARRLCGDMHVVFTRHCSALLMTRLKATQHRYARSPRRSAAPRAMCSTRPV